jgi:hypothetical protein
MKCLHIFAVLVLCLPVLSVSAETTMEMDSSAYRQLLTAPITNRLTIPTIVQIPLNDISFERPVFAVYEVETHEWVQGQYQSNSQSQSTSQQVSVAGVSLPELSDNNLRTTKEFRVAAQSSATTRLRISSARPITSAALMVQFDRNVRLPESVQIESGIDDISQIVLATTPVTSNEIVFPPTTASEWEIIFTHRQPLRLSELRFVDEATTPKITKELRFLAQPGMTYVVYLDPDRNVPTIGRESGNLWQRQTGAVIVTEPNNIMTNPAYVMSDQDRDGETDKSDNCPAVSNPDQTDIDNNAVGDACEDFDRDGVSNQVDNCLNLPNQNQIDTDGDAIGDDCDDAESRLTEKYQWIPWVALALAVVAILAMFAVIARRPAIVPVSDKSDVM